MAACRVETKTLQHLLSARVQQCICHLVSTVLNSVSDCDPRKAAQREGGSQVNTLSEALSLMHIAFPDTLHLIINLKSPVKSKHLKTSKEILYFL